MNELITKALRQAVIEKLEGNEQIMDIVNDAIHEVMEENAFDLNDETTWETMMEISSTISIA